MKGQAEGLGQTNFKSCNSPIRWDHLFKNTNKNGLERDSRGPYENPRENEERKSESRILRRERKYRGNTASREFLLDLIDLPHSETRRVLCFAARSITLPTLIALRYPNASVLALDDMTGGNALAYAMQSKEGLPNLQVGISDSSFMPIIESFFDIVLLAGVGESPVGSTANGSSSRNRREHTLAEASRVLKKGGKVIVGIENSILKSRLSSKMWHGLRSGASYEKDLLDGGFRKVRSYAAYPRYTSPRVIAKTRNLREIVRDSSKKYG